MRRITIIGLMGLVLGIAVAIAALRNADDYWAGGFMMATALLIGVVTLGAFYHSGRQRAGRLGFAVFGGGYFALAFLGLSEQNLARLPTTWLLSYVHQHVAPPQTVTFTITGNTWGPSGQGTIQAGNVAPGTLAFTSSTATSSQFAVVNGASGNPPSRWWSLLPGAANYEAFSMIGNCQFALLAGLLGAAIARRYERRQERALRADTLAGEGLTTGGPASSGG
jgi:hypothetical protein